MDDNTLDDANSPEAGRPRRAPPTIDLEASEVTASTTSTDSESADAKNDDKRSSRRSSASLQPFLVAAITGAVTAALVIAVAWAMGRPAETAQPVAEINAGAIEALSSRLAELEGRASKPAAPDAALASRFDALEKSLAGLKSDVAAARAQTAKLATDIEEIKSAPARSAASPASPDLTAIKGACPNSSAPFVPRAAQRAGREPSRRTTSRCAAWSWHRCSTFGASRRAVYRSAQSREGARLRSADVKPLEDSQARACRTRRSFAASC